jgi:hypothetical protein
MKDEFYSIAFRKKIYHYLEELQQDVDQWLLVYNRQRPYSGRYCHGAINSIRSIVQFLQ